MGHLDTQEVIGGLTLPLSLIKFHEIPFILTSIVYSYPLKAFSLPELVFLLADWVKIDTAETMQE